VNDARKNCLDDVERLHGPVIKVEVVQAGSVVHPEIWLLLVYSQCLAKYRQRKAHMAVPSQHYT
jgi:hypothetical protein